MRPEERLFKAIGEADDVLLARCEQSAKKRKTVWLPWAVAAAACLAVGVFFATSRFGPPPVDPGPVDPPPGPVDVVPPDGPDETDGPVDVTPPDDIAPPEDKNTSPIEQSDVGRFHSVKLTATAERPENTIPEFYIFVDEEGYTAFQENGVFIIRTKNLPDPSLDIPVCEMRITHRADTTLEEVRAELLAELEAEFETVIAEYEDFLYADGGSKWNSPVRDVRLIEDGQSGVFVLAADYFLEATEGHGARFGGMRNTFQVVDETTPKWLIDLQDTAEILTRGILSDRLDLVADLLTEDAQIAAYGQDVLGDGSVSGFDFTTDDTTTPSHAVVSVRVDQLEDAADFITMELKYENGKWLAYWAGIEK